ncbi:MAG: hypothetical protein CMH03_10575 [Marinovum sp.]|mgnify:FL=1|nr:hypothetical protein [Marinovum sp.]|tara:strand:+ start:2066 stop:2905 length:840 start_codon:yes stop_codon:yes gene_type:complete
MAVNHYFQGGDGIGSDNEKRLIQDLIVENLKIYGHAVYYLPRTLVNRDLILGEDSASRFDDSYLIEMYFETVEGFQGEQEIISKFGLEVRDDTTFVVSKRRFQEQVDDSANLMIDGRPNEGDVIYYPLMNKFFEVAFVEDQEPFFQLGSLPVYKLRCKTFEYSSEEFNTGNADIDQADDRKSLDTTLQYQFSLEDGTLSLTSTSGRIQLESGDKFGNPLYLIQEEYDDITTDGDAATSIQTKSAYADNLDLDTEAGFDTATVSDDILDFTESNPFGEVK